MTASPIQLLLPPLRYWPTPLPQPILQALGQADHTKALDSDIHNLPASAALSRLGEGDLDADAVRAHQWLRAEPAWIRPDLTGARLYAVGAMLPLDVNDVASFSADVQALFDDAGYQLDVVTPQRWYVRVPLDAKLPHFATPAEALGADPFDHRPEGEGAREWRVLDNEVQITLHQHGRNVKRQQAGLPPINALWWWGDAALPDTRDMSGLTIHSDDPLLRGWALAGNVPSSQLPTRWPHDADGLYDLRGVARDALLGDWLQPALDQVRQGTRMQWICEDGPTFTFARSQRWRVWRRPYPFPSKGGDVDQ